MPSAAVEKIPAVRSFTHPLRSGPVTSGIAPRPQGQVVPLSVASRSTSGGGSESGRCVRMFGVEVYDTTLEQAATWIVHRADQGLQTRIAFINAHCVNVMYADFAYRNALECCDRLFADGMGTRIAARTAGVRLQENVNGTDLFPILCREAARRNKRIYLLGGREGVSDCSARRIVRQIPELSIVGSASGYFANAEAEQRAIDDINASGADIVLIGMGVPDQELWIARNRARLTPAVLVGVGGLFDYYSGRLPRAPKLIRDVGCEWAWRLALEPRRLAKRYLYGNIAFLVRLAWLSVVARKDFEQSPALAG